MIKFFQKIVLLAAIVTCFDIYAQSTTSSPYSQFGLGYLSGSQLPQNRSLGGIAAGLRKPSSYSNINLANPASYSAIRITTFDIGVHGGLTNLSKADASENSFDASLNHLVFAVPVTKKSALSFGLVPYSSMGYNFTVSDDAGGEPVKYIYSGSGGVSKAYLGYGIQVGKGLSVGANASYLFGKLTESRAAEYNSEAFLNSRSQNNRAISGLSYDYGLQYETPVSSKVSLILGYTGSSNSSIRSKGDLVTTRYYNFPGSGSTGLAIDTSDNAQGAVTRLKLPAMHTIGFAFQRTNKWLVGGDVSLGQWKNYREGNNNPGLKNSMAVALGSQFTPDISSVGNYLNVVDYRLGFRYEKSYINYNNRDINQMAVTLGLGLPLPANRSTFYKINIGTELGQRGTLQNNLIRERFVNFYLSFTMNDQWFQKYKFD